MLKIPEVTLIMLTGKDFDKHKKAIDYSCRGIEFGGVKIIWDDKIKNINDWDKKVVFDLWRYVDTPFALFIHPDGFVVNPESWNPDWLKYDYIGAPWPLPKDDYSYRDPLDHIQRVGNGVSLRSKKLMELPTKLNLEWKPYYGYTNEDGFMCVHNKHLFEVEGCRWAPIGVAKYFSREFELPENEDVDKPFCFHTVDSSAGFHEQGRNKVYTDL